MAYAALVSLQQSLDQTLSNAGHHSVAHDLRKQSQSLLPKIEYLLKFLEDSSHKADEKTSSLVTRIREASYRAQYLVDLYSYDAKMAIIRQVPKPKNIDLRNIVREIDDIESDIRELTGSATEEANDLQLQNPFRACSPRLASEDVMVGFKDIYMELKEELMVQQSALDFVSIVGMGGIGKTTLAKNIYDDSLVNYHFEIRVWVVASQSLRNILLSILDSMNILGYEMHGQDENELRERLVLTLKQRRYLVIIDDIWDTTVWDEIRKVLPNNEYGSRVLLTTRLAHVAAYVSSSGHSHHVPLLSSEESWSLLRAKVFGDENCPPQLQQIGQKISERYGGLPLSLVVMGGLLSQIDKTKEAWLNFEKDATSADVNPCLEILKLSYDYLPEQLKPCFLYMAHFQDDEEIPVSKLIKLWVAEGFLKQVQHQDPEAVAERCLMELVDHSMILVSKHNSEGNIKTCRMHSLLHNLCVTEANKREVSKCEDSNVCPYISRNTT